MSEKEDLPDVNLVVTQDGASIVIKFDRNIGLLRMNPEVALRMGEMLKLEAVKMLRAQK